MLMKLLKHEFRATGRSMLPLLLFVLLFAVGTRISILKLLDSNIPWVNMLVDCSPTSRHGK